MTIAHPAHEPTTREEHWRAIRERTTRGLLTFNAGGVRNIEGAVWAVPSSRGGYWLVDLDGEACACEDFSHFGRDHDVSCRHIVAASIAAAKRGRECRPCYGTGRVVLEAEGDDGRPVEMAVMCRRCGGAGSL